MAPRSIGRRHASALETLSITVEEEFVPLFEQALMCVCETVGIFEADDAQKYWRIEGVKDTGYKEDELDNALSVARLLTGCEAELLREATEAEGWLARTYESFPQQDVGKRFAIRGTHLHGEPDRSRLTITLDAGIAFGSGEHGSTRGCLRGQSLESRRQAAAAPSMFASGPFTSTRRSSGGAQTPRPRVTDVQPQASVPLGATVFHQKFGEGTVIAVDGSRLEINFENGGIKRVMANFVEIRS